MAKQTLNNGESGSIIRGKINDNFTEVYTNKQDISEKGIANGYASLGADGLVPTAQLPTSIAGGDMLKSENLSGLTDYATARENLGLEIGVDVLAQRTFGDIVDSNIADFAPALTSDENYVTDAEKIVIGNTSGINTGDQKAFGGGIVTIPTITNNLDGSITLGTDGIINFFTTANGDSIPVRKNMTTGATLTMTDNAVNYVYADYNSGIPIYAVSTNAIQFFTDGTKQPVVRIVRYGTKLHTEDYDEYGLALSNKILFKNTTLAGFQRESGLVLSTSATRISTISSGSAWLGVRYRDNTSLVENKVGTSGTLEEWYLVAGVWNRSVVTSYDSSYYSDGTNRQTLGVAKYVAKYFFRDIGDDNEVYYIHGNQYNLRADAINEPLPQVSPLITSHSLYVGKIVIQQGATNGTAYNRDWGTSLENAVVTDHENLSNILQAGPGITNGHISAGAQTIDGLKTLSEGVQLEKEAIMKEIATPTNPASGYDKLYFKTDGKLYKLTSAGVESEVGGKLTNAQTGTTYTFVLTDAGKIVTFGNASATTVTIPPNSSVAFPIGTIIEGTQIGAGKVTFAQGSGVIIQSEASNKSIYAQYVGYSLLKTGTDTWSLFGKLSA